MQNGQQQTQQRAPQTQALAPIETDHTAMALVPKSLDGAFQLAEWLSKSALIRGDLRGKPADIFLVLTTGMELGLPPNASLRGIYCVNGRTALESKTKAAICLQRKAAVYFRRTEYTPEATTWETLRHGQTEPVKMRYTLAEAKAAGLTTKDGPWRQYPQRMISHRALGWLCDDVYPDIVLGVATAEDFDEEQPAFRPIAAGIELAPAPSAAQAAAAPDTAYAMGAPATTKPATPPPAPQPAAATERTPLTEEEVVAIITAIGACGTVDQLRELARTRINNAPIDDVTRDRLAQAYSLQLGEIRRANAAESGGAQ